MLTGSAPFQGQTPTDVMAAVLLKEPASLAEQSFEVPANLVRVVERTLQREKDARYQSASELLDDLRQVKQSSTCRGRAVARCPPRQRIPERSRFYRCATSQADRMMSTSRMG